MRVANSSNLNVNCCGRCSTSAIFRRIRRRTKLLEPNSVADGYNDDRGTSYIPKIKKPQPQSPPAPAGASLSTPVVAFLAISVKIKTPMNLPKYTAEQISEIIDRINTLRMGWLRQVEAQLASRQRHTIPDDYQLNSEPAE
jgi:hypothetical protein